MHLCDQASDRNSVAFLVGSGMCYQLMPDAAVHPHMCALADWITCGPEEHFAPFFLCAPMQAQAVHEQ